MPGPSDWLWFVSCRSGCGPKSGFGLIGAGADQKQAHQNALHERRSRIDAYLEVPWISIFIPTPQWPPESFNTDLGTQFTSEPFTKTLQDAGIRISMDGEGAMDRQRLVFIERLWRRSEVRELVSTQCSLFYTGSISKNLPQSSILARNC